MTILEMHTFFDLICDKYASPYFSANEKDIFINKAISSFIEDVWQNYKKIQSQEQAPPYGGESSILSIESISPLILQNELSTTDSDSMVSFPSDYSHLLNISLGGESDGCGNVSTDEYRYCRFVRHNDIYIHSQNTFKKPTIKFPVYNIQSGGFKIYPENSNRSVSLSYIRKHTPVNFSSDPAVNCELPDFTHGKIIMLALSLAGLSVREQQLMQGSDIKRQEGIE